MWWSAVPENRGYLRMAASLDQVISDEEQAAHHSRDVQSNPQYNSSAITVIPFERSNNHPSPHLNRPLLEHQIQRIDHQLAPSTTSLKPLAAPPLRHSPSGTNRLAGPVRYFSNEASPRLRTTSCSPPALARVEVTLSKDFRNVQNMVAERKQFTGR